MTHTRARLALLLLAALAALAAGCAPCGPRPAEGRERERWIAVLAGGEEIPRRHVVLRARVACF